MSDIGENPALWESRLRELNQAGLSEDQLAQVEGVVQGLLQEAEFRGAQVEALLKGAKAVLTNQRFDQAARAVFDVCRELTGARSGYVALLSEDGSENDLLFLEAGGMPCSVDESLPMPIRGLRAEAYRTANAVYDNSFASSEWAEYLPEGHVRLDNVLFAPLVLEGQAVGLLGLANNPGCFTDEDARMAAAFGELAAVALRNSRALQALEESEARARWAALHDPLTGVYNRYALREILDREAKRSQRYEHPMGLLMADVDSFKALNDQYGHHAGDEVLRTVARILRDNTREVDIVVRYGGDEFLVVMPETGEGVGQAKSRIDRAVAVHNEQCDEDQLVIHLSLGVGVWEGTQQRSLEQALAEADRAMYREKRARDG